MKRFFFTRLALAVLCLAAGNYCFAQTPPYFNVMNYGATGNGTTLDSPAVNAAIAAAGAAGGGTVTFPPGTYLCGSIHLSNCPVNLTLYLSNNAVIWGSTGNIDQPESNPYSQYQDEGHSYFHDALIWGENLQNFTIEGPGKIDGHGALTTGNPSSTQGDKDLCLVLCSNVVIDGITITNGGHFGILAQACTNMVVRNARIWEKTSRDGFNLICSSFCIVSNCDIEGSDDSMCLKSTYALGRKINCQNIRIVNCTILSTENNATQIGSETVGDFRDVTWSNLVLTAAGKAGIGITSQDGSIIDGMTYDNIIMSNCACPIFLKLDYRTTDTPNPTVGRIRNISINNVYAYHSTYYSRTNTSTINGYMSNTVVIPIENITFNNVHVSNIGRNPATAITNYPVENQDWQPQDFGNWPCYGWYLRWAGNISFTNCSVSFDNDDDRPAVIADTVTNVLFQNFTADVGSNDTNYDMGFLNGANFDVTNAFASATAPSPGADLRIFNSNSTPAQIVSPPYFSPGDGLYTNTQIVTIGSGTPGATIRYTTNDSEPSETNGTIYTNPVTIDSETVLLAIAYTNGMVDSAVNTAIYNYLMTGETAAPFFNPPPGEYATAQMVTMVSSTPNATIIYTTDGSTPNTNNGTIYTAPVSISANTTFQAFAYATNLTASGVTTGNYVITGVAAAPVFNPPGGTYTNAQSVIISSPTSDASIRYTTDGSTPSEINGTLYSTPVTISSNTTLNAIAYTNGAADSAVSTASYTIVTPPPVFEFDAQSLSYITNGAVAVLQNDSTYPSGHWLALEATATNEWIEYTIPDIPAGTYDIQMAWKGNNDRGIITFALDGTVLGNPLDQYSSGETYPTTDYGIVTFTNSGNHTILLTAVGKNPSSSSYWISAAQFFFIQLQAGLPQPPNIGSIELSGSNMLFNGANGIPQSPYFVLMSTNVTLPLADWTVVATNVFDAGGNFTFTNTANPNAPQQFYKLELQLQELP
ncbi:MAG TPA: chitobiase/beta-hexosaminidase C-terminal domain-containing protein [Candidatus Aquilonibacter sp.]|nr:chitobiase/beta-hexosaminidase C-terminal domain-containing protein [Candidatus Aquilonibacter sp.]